jgi:D-inositol-3-phosphate glycosyltransferase
VPNAVNDGVFRPGKLSSQPPALDLAPGEKLVLWVGRLEDEKNPGELIDIAEQLLERMIGIRFLIVGDLPGSYEERRIYLLEKMRLSTQRAFTFIRTVPYDRMPDLYRLVRQTGGVLICTSLHESLPMIFLEAMACGCPILSTDVGGVRDIILDGSTGRLYPAGDLGGAVKILQGLLSAESAKSVERMTWRARRQIERHYSLRVVARRYKQLLDDHCSAG